MLRRLWWVASFTVVAAFVLVVAWPRRAAVPNFMLKSQARQLRRAVAQFRSETGVLPESLTDLAANTAPAYVDPKRWHGPYIERVNDDPISGQPFKYDPGTGTVRFSAQGLDRDGVPYSSY
jgi:hypothetical protein